MSPNLGLRLRASLSQTCLAERECPDATNARLVPISSPLPPGAGRRALQCPAPVWWGLEGNRCVCLLSFKERGLENAWVWFLVPPPMSWHSPAPGRGHAGARRCPLSPPVEKPLGFAFQPLLEPAECCVTFLGFHLAGGNFSLVTDRMSKCGGHCLQSVGHFSLCVFPCCSGAVLT